MTKVLCIPCSIEFPTDISYKVHKQQMHGGHIPISNGATSSLLFGVTEEMLPTSDFVEAVNRIEKNKSDGETVDNPIINPNKPPQPTSDPKLLQQLLLQPKEPEPLRLAYVWHGDCPIHKQPVESFTVTIPDGTYCLAQCMACKMTVKQQKVQKLNNESSLKQKSVKRAKIKSQRVFKKDGEK